MSSTVDSEGSATDRVREELEKALTAMEYASEELQNLEEDKERRLQDEIARLRTELDLARYLEYSFAKKLP